LAEVLGLFGIAQAFTLGNERLTPFILGGIVDVFGVKARSIEDSKAGIIAPDEMLFYQVRRFNHGFSFAERLTIVKENQRFDINPFIVYDT
jgi:hypothetical protein